MKFLIFLKLVFLDFLKYLRTGPTFSEYGLTCFVGVQGAGKTIALVEYCRRMKKRFPRCVIVSNFDLSIADHRMESWRDFFKYRNGTDGVIFAIDEIQLEFSALDWKDFPPELLGEISQQRKQAIKIVTTSQRFMRMAKPLREQTFEVVECFTLLGRLTFLRAFDAWDYEVHRSIGATAEKSLKKLWARSFVQDDALRSCYDSYSKVKRLQRKEFIARGRD